MTEQRMTIWEDKNATIWVYPKHCIMHHQLHHFFYGLAFRSILTASLDAFETYNCTKWLSDDRNFGAILPDDKAWGDDVWRPRMLEAGWKFWAMVPPSKVTGKMNIQKMVEEYMALGVSSAFFTQPEEALDWLLAQI
ncbi:MAG: hypothetical protein JXR76_13855 [Deltaproteobacteria bacterium]|nr:hypothetical protein [Deltaproteobacteria bacterium]